VCLKEQNPSKWTADVFPALIQPKLFIDETLDAQDFASFLYIDFHERVDVFNLCKRVNVGFRHHLVEGSVRQES
jgi:hypothetical protein